MLTRDQILAASDLPREEVQVPEWGGSVFIKTMTGTQRDTFESEFNRLGIINARARLAILTVCDAEGNPLFDAKDLLDLGAKSGAALDRIFTAAMKLNRMGKEDIEALEGNSNASPSADSASGSP